MATKNINASWQFTKDAITVAEGYSVLTQGNWEALDLPHTWNGKDGQDGGNDYHRGTCYYVKNMKREEFGSEPITYIEFNGANSSAWLYVNGKEAGHHDGGYSTWRVNVTDFLADENEIVVAVDNAPNDHVYPQMADFTFYGGLYRDVNVISVPETHFDLDYYGTHGIAVTPIVEGANASVEVEVFVTDATEEDTLEYVIKNGDEVIATKSVSANETKVTFEIENVHLWNGRKDPHLYTAEVTLKRNDTVLDERSTRFGCRTFVIDPEKGFILNGERYPLHGVSRHQDRPHIGNALTHKEHKEDIELILEMGANTIRLAHYQHDQYIYDLCDETGLVLWAEIPYISKHLPNGRENTISQMKELIIQNYNHPSIVTWGISNEITISTKDNKDMLDNHRELNDLCHKMDSIRPTTLACYAVCGPFNKVAHLSDLVSWNLYLGWYVPGLFLNDWWISFFHRVYPNRCLGYSEYGCEGMPNLHSSRPRRGDHTEEYQSLYHEFMLKCFERHPYMWSTHVWNMFDFAADARDQGGEPGMNHKGLMTFDRKVKKDSFYIYKAYWSKEPFVHLCGSRYVDRTEAVTTVKVYSNQTKVALYANGKLLEEKTGNKVFEFRVPLNGEVRLEAVSGQAKDTSTIRRVSQPNPDYKLKKSKGKSQNWV